MLGYRRVRRHPAVRGRLVVSLARLRDPLLVDARERSGSSRACRRGPSGTGPALPPLLSSLLPIVSSAPRRVAGAAATGPAAATTGPAPAADASATGTADRARSPLRPGRPRRALPPSTEALERWLGGGPRRCRGCRPHRRRGERRGDASGRGVQRPRQDAPVAIRGRVQLSAIVNRDPEQCPRDRTRYRCCCATCANRVPTRVRWWLDGRTPPREMDVLPAGIRLDADRVGAPIVVDANIAQRRPECRRGRPRDRRREPSSTRVPGRRAGRRQEFHVEDSTPGDPPVQPRQPGSGAHRRGPSAPNVTPHVGARRWANGRSVR